jgi:hypothetical protein
MPMLRWIGTFEWVIIGVLCLFVFMPFLLGLVIRLLRGVKPKQ